MSKQTVDLGDNLSDAAAALAGDEPLAPAARAPKVKAKPVEERVKIMLEDNDQIPPGGQFVGVNGRTFMIQAGYEVTVPRSVLDVLDNAVMSVPITNSSRQVVGYRDRLRFPYRVITESRRANGDR